MKLAYCDYIAHRISKLLHGNHPEGELFCGSPQMDLSPEGCFQSTKKTIEMQDWNGKQYKVTIEEVQDED